MTITHLRKKGKHGNVAIPLDTCIMGETSGDNGLATLGATRVFLADLVCTLVRNGVLTEADLLNLLPSYRKLKPVSALSRTKAMKPKDTSLEARPEPALSA